MVGWHHLLNGHEFEQILGGSEGQGILECCRLWGRTESDMTEATSQQQSMGWQRVRHDLATEQKQQQGADLHLFMPKFSSVLT